MRRELNLGRFALGIGMSVLPGLMLLALLPGGVGSEYVPGWAFGIMAVVGVIPVVVTFLVCVIGGLALTAYEIYVSTKEEEPRQESLMKYLEQYDRKQVDDLFAAMSGRVPVDTMIGKYQEMKREADVVVGKVESPVVKAEAASVVSEPKV